MRADHLDLGITMAQSTALRLIDPQMKARALTPENFDQHRPKLEKEAARFFVLTAGRDPLVPRKVEAQFTEEQDVIFKIIYPRPPPGRLHFQAAFLVKLGQGYGSILEAADTSGNHLGWEQLSAQNPQLEVTVFPPGQGPAKKS